MDTTIPFAENTDKKYYPTTIETGAGFQCGAADLELFNGVFNQIYAELGAVINAGGVTPSNGDRTQVLQSIQALISAATGGGATADYVLLSQASTRVPLYPEVEGDGVIVVTSPSVGVVRIPAGIKFTHRGLAQYITVETEFNTAANNTYHVRWTPSGGYTMAAVDPIGETGQEYDTTYDDMLICRVTTNSSNSATISNLKNKNRLIETVNLAGTSPISPGENGASFRFNYIHKFSRTPVTITPIATRIITATGQDRDFRITNFSDTETTDPTATRYSFDKRILMDYATSLNYQFTIEAR